MFTEAELSYLAEQTLGRLATIRSDGTVQNNPVGFTYNPVERSIDVGGMNLGETHKFANVAANPNVAIVIDDLVSRDPWVVRGIEIRGQAEAIQDEEPATKWMSRQVIRIRPMRVISWGVDPGLGTKGRNVPAGLPPD